MPPKLLKSHKYWYVKCVKNFYVMLLLYRVIIIIIQKILKFIEVIRFDPWISELYLVSSCTFWTYGWYLDIFVEYLIIWMPFWNLFAHVRLGRIVRINIYAILPIDVSCAMPTTTSENDPEKWIRKICY